MKISIIIGTRPELIKMAPLVWELQKKNYEFDIVNAAQHKDLLEPYWYTFNITPSHVLDLMVEGQSLASLTSRALIQIQSYIDTVNIKPTIIVAQGDTTTVMAVSMICFYNRIKFAHLEAGLRSFDLQNPFPEEFNRRIASISADFFFCPTKTSFNNLLNEGVEKSKLFLVGNTVIDTISILKENKQILLSEWNNKSLIKISHFEKVVFVSCHRRENHGDNLLEIIDAITELARCNLNIVFVWTLHPNPNVKNVVNSSKLSLLSNVLLVEPLDYIDVLKILNLSYCAISDSGGIQEEAPSFNTPVLVLRKVTERPEGVLSGISFLVGAEKSKIISEFYNLKDNYPIFNINPYGDGMSSKRIFDILTQYNLVDK